MAMHTTAAFGESTYRIFTDAQTGRRISNRADIAAP